MAYVDSALVEGYAKQAARLGGLVAAWAACLRDERLAALQRRELKDRAEVLAERIARHLASIKELALPGREEALFRAERLFLAELEAAVEENQRFLERRVGPEAAQASRAPADAAAADRSLRLLEGEYAPAPRTADALGLVALRAAELAAEAARSKEEDARRLERDFLAVKLRAFLDKARLMRAENPELLWKCRSALERRLAEGGPAVLGAESPAPGVVALRRLPEGGLGLALEDKGIAIELELLAAGPLGGPRVRGSVTGQGGSERAEFSLAADPLPGGAAGAAALGAAALGAGAAGGRPTREAAFSAFLRQAELEKLRELALGRLGILEGSSREEPAAASAARLSSALDELL